MLRIIVAARRRALAGTPIPPPAHIVARRAERRTTIRVQRLAGTTGAQRADIRKVIGEARVSRRVRRHRRPGTRRLVTPHRASISRLRASTSRRPANTSRPPAPRVAGIREADSPRTLRAADIPRAVATPVAAATRADDAKKDCRRARIVG